MPAAAIDITSALQNSLSMPRPERSYLAERLLVSLEDDDEMPPQWSEEMDARVQRRERGVTRSYSHEEVMTRGRFGSVISCRSWPAITIQFTMNGVL